MTLALPTLDARALVTAPPTLLDLEPAAVALCLDVHVVVVVGVGVTGLGWGEALTGGGAAFAGGGVDVDFGLVRAYPARSSR